MANPEPIKLVVCIVERGGAERITRLCYSDGIAFHLMLRGVGTADSEIMDLLGLGEREKDIVLISVKRSEADALLETLAEEMHLERPGTGIAFTIPLSSVATGHALRILSGIDAEKLKEHMRQIAEAREVHT